MLIRSIEAEWSKLRHSMIWAVLLVLPVISILLGSGNYFGNRQILSKEWYSLWTQVVLFYGYFFFPVLISICCAYSCRLEHFNHNWNSLMTAPIPIEYVFIAKLISIGMLTLFVHLFTCGLYLLAGFLFKFQSPIPFELIGWFIRGFCASLVIAALQLCLSMLIKSFAASVGLCMGGCIVGLALMLKGYGMFFPYSLLSLGLGSVSQKGLSANDNLLFAGMTVLFIAVFSLWGIGRLKRKDVIA